MALAGNPIATNQGFRSLVPGDDALAEYLYYWLKLNTEELERHASGTTFRELSGSSLKAIRMCLPPLDEQRAIGRILGALDDKIELNRRMSATLEAMARALFKSWFVDFEPARAKMEGRSSGLPPALDALFPASFEASELGEIPSGWGVGTLGQVAKQLRENENPMKSPDTVFSHFSIPAYDQGQVPRREVGESIRSTKTKSRGRRHARVQTQP